MFLLRNGCHVSQLLMVVIVVALGLSSPVTSLIEVTIWSIGMLAISALSYFRKLAEQTHLTHEEARVIEIEPKWGGTNSTLATLETLSGIRLYQRFESKIEAPHLGSKLWVYYDPDDTQTFSIRMPEDKGDALWWIQTLMFLAIGETIILVGYFQAH